MDEVDPLVAAWCAAELGSPAVGSFFAEEHLTAVLGVELADGRQVAVKERCREPRLLGCAAVQRALHGAGIPCPRPLAGPSSLGEPRSDHVLTAESWEPGGASHPAGDPAAAYAALLARIVGAAPGPGDVPTLDPPTPWLHYDHDDPDRIWPPPASHEWDPHRLGDAIPAHVRETAARARHRLLRDDVRALAPVVGHSDLSGINVRWHDGPAGERSAPLVHDWDSVVARPEAVLAGCAAADHASDDRCRLAEVHASERFLDRYVDRKGARWSAVEREAAWAAGAWVAAYNAAFEHLKGGAGPVSHALERQADERLHRAGA
ncbi:MAG: hypothetical protein ACRC50_10015 [Gaiella sp.]